LYNLTFIANDTSNNLNASETSNFTVNDTVNPTILDLIPAINSEYNTLQTIEIAVNVTDDVNVSQVFANVSLVNGTITEVELSLDSSNRYNNTYTIPASVNGTYNITFIANDTSGNYNTTNTTNFTAVSIDTDGDGADDAIDTLIGNESDITSQGVAGLNITVGGAQVNGTFTGENEVLFFNDSLLFVNFTHNFSLSGLNLSNFTINFTSTSLVVNFSGQIQRGYNKTLYFPDNSYTSICVEDGEIDSDTDISSTCDGTNEIDFDTCVGVSSGTTISGKTCYDNGTTITIENLSFSGVRGTTTAAAAPTAASAAASSSSGGSSLPPSADVGEAADAGDTGDSSPGSSEPGPSGPTGAAVSPPGPSNLAGKAFFGDFGEFSQQFGRYILTGILAVLALGTFTYGGRKIHHKIKHRHTLIHKPMEQVPNRSLRIVPMTFIDPKEPMDDKIDSINQQLAALQVDEVPEPKKQRLFPKLFQSNTKEVILANELDNLNQEIHGYERTQILDKPKGKQEWDYRLEEIEIALGDVEVKGSKGRIITSTAETKDDYGNTQNAIMGKELERISQTLQGKEKVIPKISKLKKVKNYEDLEDQADDATGYELEEIENELKRLEDM
ncbi:hypothetical protein HQ489_04800, partial [Candidatus Woesearchaeota archaeon]|nr:hypothetical protein [Candidatus Woesearchaeota archaeon]